MIDKFHPKNMALFCSKELNNKVLEPCMKSLEWNGVVVLYVHGI